MRKNGTRTMTSVHSCFEGTEDEDELKFYPIFKTIKCVENYFKDTGHYSFNHHHRERDRD